MSSIINNQSFNKICDWEIITRLDDFNENTNQKTGVVINSTKTPTILHLLHIFQVFIMIITRWSKDQQTIEAPCLNSAID